MGYIQESCLPRPNSDSPTRMSLMSIMSIMGEYQAVKYSSLFDISCIICHQLGECSHVMLSPRQGKYFNRKKEKKTELNGQFKVIFGEKSSTNT